MVFGTTSRSTFVRSVCIYSSRHSRHTNQRYCTTSYRYRTQIISKTTDPISLLKLWQIVVPNVPSERIVDDFFVDVVTVNAIS